MRILHTSDWHLGKTLEGRSRFEEQQRFIDELCHIVEEEKINLVLIAGDIFDSVNPPASAEELYYEALDRLADRGRRAVVIIAGNHDNPERLCAAQPLASKNGIIMLGLPKDAIQADKIQLTDRVCKREAGVGWSKIGIPGCGEEAVLALLPYPSESRLQELLTTTLNEDERQADYSERIRQLLAYLGSYFRGDTVNIGVSHLYLRGGFESDSERQIQMGGALSVAADALPTSADYFALGHLHRPQKVSGALTNARYAGSPIAYSFSESGYAKSVTIVDVIPGKAADIKEIYLNSGYPLVRWQAKEGLAQVYQWISQGRDEMAWLDLEINLTTPLSQQEIYKLRELRERIINIRPIFPETAELSAEKRSTLPLDELFRRFYRKQNAGGEAQPELVKLFMELVSSNEEQEEDSRGEELA